MPGTAFIAANWTGYDEQSWSNPASALTDFTGLIDVSQLSANWKSEVQSDGADIRLTKGDGTTELPYDLIDWAYNAGAPTGWIRFKWSGTLASSGTQNTRVWAGYTGGTAVAYGADETNGSDNAYDGNWLAYWAAGGGVDRTANGNDGTAVSTPTVISGKVGNATQYDATDAYTTAANVSGADPRTLLGWLRTDVRGTVAEISGSSLTTWRFDVNPGASAGSLGAPRLSFSGGNIVGSTAIDNNAWRHFGARLPSGDNTVGDHDLFADGVIETISGVSNSTGVINTSTNGMRIGNSITGGPAYDGDVDELQLHSTDRSDDWIAQEYSQSNDNATFWGAWAWTAADTGGGSAPPLMTLLGVG